MSQRLLVLLFLGDLWLVAFLGLPITLAFRGNYNLAEWTLASVRTRPHEVTVDPLGMIWFTGKGSTSEVGSIPGGSPPAMIGRLNPSTNTITEWPLPPQLWNGTAENLAIDLTPQGTVVWFDIRWLLQPLSSLIARLTLNSSNTGMLQWWFPEDPTHYKACLSTGTVLIHGLDVVRNSTGNISAVWFLKEVDSSPGATTNCSMQPGPYEVSGPVVQQPFSANSTAHVISYYPKGLFQAAPNGAGDFLLVDKNSSIWFITDDETPPTIYHLSPAGCPPTCTGVYETWPISNGGAIQGERPQAFAITPDGTLWLEDRTGIARPNGTSVSLLERHIPQGNSVSISVWTTPHLIIDDATTIPQVNDESDVLLAPIRTTNPQLQSSQTVVWFTEHWADRVVAFNPMLQSPNITSTVAKSSLDSNVTQFDVDSNSSQQNFVSYGASLSMISIACNAPAGFEGFSECPSATPPLSGAGPNGLAYQSSTGCIWFTEQDADRIGRLCPLAPTVVLGPLGGVALSIGLLVALVSREARRGSRTVAKRVSKSRGT